MTCFFFLKRYGEIEDAVYFRIVGRKKLHKTANSEQKGQRRKIII
jgi:hypothetical protein